MSRLPPPPPGLPSRPVDSYRSAPPRNERYESRQYGDRRDDRDRQSMYQFGSNNDHYRRSPPRNDYSYGNYAPGTAPPPLRSSDSVYRPQYRQNGGRPGDFTFRSEAPPSIAAAQADVYRPRSPRPHRNNFQQNNNGYRQDPSRGRGGFRGRGAPRLASDREFLKGNREPTPELMPGMDEEDAGVRYKPVDDVSDSDEAEMDMSDDETGVAEQPQKKARTVNKAADGDSVPRWSNPDPYTALPPPDESQRKKKDVVKLIRKARVETISSSAAKVDPADDFISFDLGDEGDSSTLNYNSPDKSGMGVEGAPTGPRFSQRGYIHNPQVPSASAPTLPPRVASQQDQAQVKIQALQARTPSENVRDRVDGQNSQAQAPKQNIHARADSQNIQVQVNHENIRHSKPASLDTISDPALGSRKRNFQDEIKAAPILHHIGKGKSGKPATGVILKQWQPNKENPSTPWADTDHSDTANMGLWLHKEIVDFYHYVKPRDFESVIRKNLVEDLSNRLKTEVNLANWDIHTFGSFPAGLYLPTADMDLVCVSDQFMRNGKHMLGRNKSFYHNFGRFIDRQNLAIQGSIEIITGAKVPLVKYIDKLTGLKVDISFENNTGLVANRTFQDWKTQFPAMPVIVTLIKHLLAMRGLNEPVNGGIGGFSVTCLVVSLLQLMPQVQSRNMVPEHHLGEILMEFFDLYGNEFNTTANAIQFNPPSYISKAHTGTVYNARNIDRLSILDPNNSQNDIAGGSGNTKTILKCFSQAYLDLQKRMSDFQCLAPENRRNYSILGGIIGGNYTSFRRQREHLAYVYEKLYGPIQVI